MHCIILYLVLCSIYYIQYIALNQIKANKYKIQSIKTKNIKTFSINFCKHNSYIYYVKNHKCYYVSKPPKKRMKAKTKFKIALSVILIFIVLIFFYYLKIVCPIIVTLSEERIRSLSTRVMSTAVAEVLVRDNVTYDDIVTIKYDNQNDIKSIETNSVKINIIIREITEMVQARLDGLIVEGIDVALGTFTGIPFLFGLGPNISLQLVPIGTINTKISSTFTTAGINQTIHKVYFDITANIGMVLPALSSNFVTNLDVILCESVIVGKVPEFYLQGGILNQPQMSQI